MKRIVISVLVVALLLGLGYIGLSHQLSAAPPQEPAPEGPVLWKVKENLTLAPGQEFESAWQDARSFRLFKFYAISTTSSITETRPVKVRVQESPVSGEGGAIWKVAPQTEDEWYQGPVMPTNWLLMSEFNGIYSMVRVKATNESSQPATISLYLLAAPE